MWLLFHIFYVNILHIYYVGVWEGQRQSHCSPRSIYCTFTGFKCVHCPCCWLPFDCDTDCDTAHIKQHWFYMGFIILEEGVVVSSTLPTAKTSCHCPITHRRHKCDINDERFEYSRLLRNASDWAFTLCRYTSNSPPDGLLQKHTRTQLQCIFLSHSSLSLKILYK